MTTGYFHTHTHTRFCFYCIDIETTLLTLCQQLWHSICRGCSETKMRVSCIWNYDADFLNSTSAQVTDAAATLTISNPAGEDTLSNCWLVSGFSSKGSECLPEPQKSLGEHSVSKGPGEECWCQGCSFDPNKNQHASSQLSSLSEKHFFDQT